MEKSVYLCRQWKEAIKINTKKIKQLCWIPAGYSFPSRLWARSLLSVTKGDRWVLKRCWRHLSAKPRCSYKPRVERELSRSNFLPCLSLSFNMYHLKLSYLSQEFGIRRNSPLGSLPLIEISISLLPTGFPSPWGPGSSFSFAWPGGPWRPL